MTRVFAIGFSPLGQTTSAQTETVILNTILTTQMIKAGLVLLEQRKAYVLCACLNIIALSILCFEELAMGYFSHVAASRQLTPQDGIWMNRNDLSGTIMSIIVWILIAYSGITITLLAESGHLSHNLAITHCSICAMALASHAKTMFSDPGAVPLCAVPVNSAARRAEAHTMCSTCRSFKPPGSHHCRICDRCISRMDHHCPWMNNCIGATNSKFFILFLVYTWIGSALALIIFGCNYFLCNDHACEFSGILVHLVRVMSTICIISLLFTSSMLSNVTFGIITGIGTIDRLKKKASTSLELADDSPMQLEHIFGIGSYITWLLPTDPVFADHDNVLGYSMPQRLLREGHENTSSS